MGQADTAPRSSSLSTAAGFAACLCWLAAGPVAAAPKELKLLSTEHARGFAGLPEGFLYPQLEARFAGGEAHRIPANFVFDAEILETLPATRRHDAVTLDLRDAPGSRLVVLLAFDVSGWLGQLGRSAGELTAVDLLLWTFPQSAPARDQRFVERLGLFSPPPPPPGGPVWEAETLADMTLNWNEAGARGLHPVNRRPPYPAEQHLASVESPEGLVELAAFLGPGQKVYSPQARFAGRKLTDHVRAELTAARFARFVLFFDAPFPRSAGAGRGAWPSGFLADHRQSGLADAVLTAPLTLDGRNDDAFTGVTSGSVVGPSDTLTVLADGRRLASFNPSCTRLGAIDLGAACRACPGTSLEFAAFADMEVLSDGSLAVLAYVRSSFTENAFQVILLHLDQETLELKRETMIASTAGTRPSFLDVVASPAGNVFVAFVGRTQNHVFEVDPASGQTRELTGILPTIRTFPSLAFDDSGNLFIAGISVPVDIADPNNLLRVVSLDPEGAVRFTVNRQPVRALGRTMALPDGRLVLQVSTSTAILDAELLFIDSTGAVEAVVVPDTRSLKNLDGSGRLVFDKRTGPPEVPVFYSLDSGEITLGERFPAFPHYALAGGGFLTRFPNRAPNVGSSAALLDAEGFPLGVEHCSNTTTVRPSSDGLYVTVLTGLSQSLRHYRAGGEFLHEDLEPLDWESPTIPNFRDCIFVKGAGTFTPFTVGAPVLAQPFPGSFISYSVVGPSSGSELFGVFQKIECRVESLSRLEDCSNFICPSQRPGTLVIYPKHSRPPFAPDEYCSYWTTARRVFHVADGPDLLRVDPPVQTISPFGTASLSATRGGAPEVVSWRVVKGEELLSVPLAEEGSSVEVVPRPDAPPGRIVIAAKALPGNPPGSAGAVVVLRHPPRLVPLDPDPNPPASSVRKGGSGFRYYRMVAGPDVVLRSGGPTYSYTAVFRVRETGKEFTAWGLSGAPSSHGDVLRDLLPSQPGLLAVRIPYTALGDAATVVPITRTVDLTAFRDPSGTNLAPAEPLSFEVSVEERTYSRTLEYSTGVIAGPIGKISLGGQGSLTVVDRDFTRPGADEQLIGLRVAGGGGAEVGLDVDIGFGIQGPEAKAFLQVVGGIDFRFVPADADPAVRDFVVNQAVRAASLGQRAIQGLTPFAVIDEFANPETGLLRSLADLLSGRVTAEAILNRTEAVSVAGVLDVVPLDLSVHATLPFGEDIEAFLEFSAVNVAMNATVELTTNIGRESPGRTSRLTLAGEMEFLKVGALGITFCPLDSCGAATFSEAVTVDPLGRLQAIEVTIESSDVNGPKKKTWRVEGQDAHEVLRANCGANFGLLALLAVCTDCIECPPEEIVRTLSVGQSGSLAGLALGPLGLANVATTAASEIARALSLPLRLDRATWTADRPQEIEAGLTPGVDIAGVGIELNIGRKVKQESLRSAGVLLQHSEGRTEFPLEEYTVPDAFEPRLEAQSLLDGFLASLQSVGEVSSSSLLREAFDLFAAKEGVINHPPGGGGRRAGGGGLPEPDIFLLRITYDRNATVSVTAWPKPAPDPEQPVVRTDVGRPSPSIAHVVIGQYHGFVQDSPGTARILSATLTLGYPEGDLGGLDEARLQIGRWDPVGRAWVLLGGAVDAAANTVTAAITAEGTHAVLYSIAMACSVLDPLDVRPGEVRVTWSAAPEPEVTGYSVYRGRRGSPDLIRIAVLGAGAASFADSTLANEESVVTYAVASRFGPGAEGCLSTLAPTDLDGDDISDLYELRHGLSPAADNSATDADGDGLTDLAEVLLGTDPARADTDGDGLGDAAEAAARTNPREADTDRDGLPDGDEIAIGTGPLLPDTDRDGLKDGEEAQVHGSDPLLADTDGEGLPDGDEVALYGTDPTMSDTDLDEVDDRTELFLGLDPSFADTDQDGATDGREMMAGTNPLDPASFPEGTVPPPRLALLPASQTLSAGTPGTITATLTPPPMAEVVLSLTSSAPQIVGVPASVAVPAAAPSAAFDVTGLAPGGPVTITARLPAALGGASASVEVTVVRANAPPLAAFSASPEAGPAPLEVAFDGSASTDPDGVITAFAWNFGDGTIAAGAMTAHTYAAEGDFTATLTVTDDGGASASTSRTIRVFAPGGLVRPGDANSDGFLDISDAVSLLGYLFLGAPARLPCGAGSLDEPANVRLLDSNGDGAVDLTDAVHKLGFLFLGGLPPVLGTDCVPSAGCPPACQ